MSNIALAVLFCILGRLMITIQAEHFARTRIKGQYKKKSYLWSALNRAYKFSAY